MRDYSDLITWVAVADGEKALILRNEDTDDNPFLNVVSTREIDNPPTRDQAANRRGRMQDGGAGGAQRSAVEDTDWHTLEKERFAKDFTERLNKAALKNAFDRLVLFAPPQTLGKMREEYHGELEKRVVKEVPSDLTNHTVDDIEKQVAKALHQEAPEKV